MKLDSLVRSYLIPGLVPDVGRIALYGAPKKGKSFLALQLALAVCQGTPFLGYPVTKPGPVLYLQFDTPPELWRERLDKLQSAGVNIGGDIYFIDPRTQPKRVNILNDQHAQDFRDMITATLPVLVVIDVLRSIHHLSENESEHMQQVVNRLTSICANRALLIVHHTSKPSLAPGSHQQSASFAGRGSSYLGGEMDANWLLRGKGEGRAALVVEARFAAPFNEITLVQNADTGLWARSLPGRRVSASLAYAKAVELDPELPNLSIRQAAERSGIDRGAIQRARKHADTQT